MSLEKINTPINNKKNILNNLNDSIIEIDYFDQKGIKKHKNIIPLKYVFNSKTNNNQALI